jgi:hypothetical protein
MIRNIISIIIFFLLGTALHSQDIQWKDGKVTFLSSRNVYVKFASTELIEIGDSLYIKQGNDYIPAMVVGNKSSTSTVCTPFANQKMNKGDDVFAKVPVREPEEEVLEEEPEENQSEEVTLGDEVVTEPVITPDEDIVEPKRKEKINARLSVASYSNFSDFRELHRMRYAFTYRAKNIKNSKLSIDNYITFRHTLGEWEEVKDNLGRALKVYALSVNYAFDSTAHLTAGRRINPRTTSLGAIDGLQYEKQFGGLIVGGIAGTRPDYSDYSFNPNLLQFGVYASLIARNPANYQQTTFGAIEQHNGREIDRRFVYFQHSSTPLKNLNLFSSFEIDLYESINNEAQNSFRLTNLYVSLRYRLGRRWRLSASYDSRKNIIYYESYKNFIDRLIDQETRQGLRFGFNYRPVKLVTLGVNSSWRFKKSDLNLSKNVNAYLNFTQIPVVKIRASLSANYLQTNYLTSNMFGIRLSRPIINRKLDADIYFRIIDYRYQHTENQVSQHITGASLSLRIMKQLTLHMYYEGTFDNKDRTYHRFNSKIIRRF